MKNALRFLQALLYLRNCKAFEQYPIKMQRRIAQAGIFERYDAKRIIVRQGHRASAFYFVLSGSVVVIIMDYAEKFARPVAFLNKGMTFGVSDSSVRYDFESCTCEFYQELAIINRTIRQATCIAKETVELLSLSIDVNNHHEPFFNLVNKLKISGFSQHSDGWRSKKYTGSRS